MKIHFFWWKTPDETIPGRYQVSNLELVKGALIALGREAEVVFHHSNDRGRVTTDPNDILLGHPPYPTLHEYDNWIFDNGFDGPRSAHPNTFVMYPYARANFTTWNVPLATYASAARAFFGMGGVEHYDYSILNAPADSIWRQIQPKYVRVNMGCDPRFLPQKRDYNRRPPGLLHVSSLAKYKKPELMFKSLPHDKCDLYVGTFAVDKVDEFWRQGLLPGTTKIVQGMDNGDPKINAQILEHCSFYLHCAQEPQATTILENCARGLVPILNPASGFRSPHAIYLTEDPAQNQEIIAKALDMSEDEYAERSQGVRRQIEEYHSWDRIFGQIAVDMRALVAGKDVNRRGDELS